MDILYSKAQAAKIARVTVDQLEAVVAAGQASPDFYCEIPMQIPGTKDFEMVTVVLFSILSVEEIARAAGATPDPIDQKIMACESALRASRLREDGERLEAAARQGKRDSERYNQLKKSMGLAPADIVPVIDGVEGLGDALDTFERLSGTAAHAYFTQHEAAIKAAMRSRGRNNIF